MFKAPSWRLFSALAPDTQFAFSVVVDVNNVTRYINLSGVNYGYLA